MNEKKEYLAIAQRIKQARKEKKLTITELANIIGVAQSTMYYYESGQISNLNMDKLKKIAEALEIDVEELIGLNEPATKHEAIKQKIDKLNDEQANALNTYIDFLLNTK